MREHLNKDDSPPNRESEEENHIEKKKNQCNACNALHVLHEPRNNRSIRLRSSIHEAVKRYCAFANMTVGQFYEEAAILFMDLNPVNGAVLNVERTRTDTVNLKDKMMNLICIQELNEFLPVLKINKQKGYLIHKSLLGKITKTFDKCYKISDVTDELNMLIEEVLRYIE